RDAVNRRHSGGWICLQTHRYGNSEQFSLVDVPCNDLVAGRRGLNDTDMTGEQEEEKASLFALREEFRIFRISRRASGSDDLIQVRTRETCEVRQSCNERPVQIWHGGHPSVDGPGFSFANRPRASASGRGTIQ